MRRISALVIALVGCHGADSPPVAQEGPPPPPPVLHAPHSHVIRMVAVADGGDAALSVDDGNELRLWPSLDGTREPVVVPGTAGKQIALGRDGSGFIAVSLDTSGGAEVIALGPEGMVRGRHELAIEPACDEVRVVGGRVLVRRRDQSIEWRDGNAALVSRIAAPYGERLLALAARRDRVLVMFDDDGTTTRARWLELHEHLAWGADVKLSHAVVPPIGLSPSGTRLIAMQPNGQAELVDLGSHATTTLALDVESVTSGTTAGFLDDGHAIYGGGGRLGFWSSDGTARANEDQPTRPGPRDDNPKPLIGDSPITPDSLVECDVGDGVILSGRGPVLQLRTWTRTRYLGYRLVGAGASVVADGDRALISNGTKLAIVDRTLHAQQLAAVDDLTALVGQPAAIDAHHIAFAATHAGEILVGIVDLSGPHPHLFAPDVLLGRFHTVTAIVWAPDAQVLSVVADLELHRFAVDPKTWRHQVLPTLPYPGGMIATLDPARTAGISVLIAYTFGNDKTRLFTYHEDGARLPAAVQDFDYRPLHIDRSGTVYAANATKLVAVRDGHDVWKTVTRRPIEAGAPSVDGTLFAYVGGGELAVIDHDGNERWHWPIWKATHLTWLGGDRTVIATTQGGLVAFDAATGERVGTGCGWGFGLYDAPPAEQDFATPNVCQEPV